MSHPVDELLEDWKTALRRSDAVALADLVTEDSEFWTPGQPPLNGPAAVQRSFEALFQNYRMEQRFEETERMDFGDYVLLRGAEHNIITPRKGVGEATIHQRVFTLARRDGNRWRFARGISQFLAP